MIGPQRGIFGIASSRVLVLMTSAHHETAPVPAGDAVAACFCDAAGHHA